MIIGEWSYGKYYSKETLRKIEGFWKRGHGIRFMSHFPFIQIW